MLPFQSAERRNMRSSLSFHNGRHNPGIRFAQEACCVRLDRGHFQDAVMDVALWHPPHERSFPAESDSQGVQRFLAALVLRRMMAGSQ